MIELKDLSQKNKKSKEGDMASGTINRTNEYDILYDTPFQSGSVTLKSNISNYEYIEIIFGNDAYRVKNNYGSSVNIILCSYGMDVASSSNPGLIESWLRCSISGTTFTVTDHWRKFSYKNSTTPTIDNVIYNQINEIRGHY